MHGNCGRRRDVVRVGEGGRVMAESVDALVSNSSGAIHPGSIPGLGTKMERSFTSLLFSFIYLSIYTHLSLHIYPLTSYHIPHSTKTFTAIYLE